jgi:2-(1,2-epoxy-1,2-dihydrophenyl)acetyl-CoA isomerase
MSEAVKVERHGAVAVLRLDDPSAMNALSPAVKAGMEKNVPTLVGDASVRAMVITGTGKAFCAGGDIRAMQAVEGRKAPAVRTRMKEAHAWARALLDCDKPVIAAVNGAAVGGGLALALLADLIVASREAYFMSGYSKLGALPDLGLLQTLPWAIGSLRAKEMILLNRRYTADEAVAIGLANRAVAPERLMPEALAMAEEIAAGPGPMLSMSKVMMKRAYEAGVEEFFEREAIAQGVAFGSAEFNEGVEAFLSKRKPRFNG